MTSQTRLRRKDHCKNTNPKKSGALTRRIAALDARVSLRDIEPKDDGLLLVGMCTIAEVAKRGHFFEGTYGRRVWKKLTAAGLHEPTEFNDDETWGACGHGITDLVKRPVRSNASLKKEEIAAGVEVLRKKVKKWRTRAILFAFKNVAEAALGQRGLAPGRLPDFAGIPAFLLTGPYAKREAAAEEAAQLGTLCG